MKITIYGEPIGKKRPRFANRGKYVAAINDQETEEGKFLAMAKTQWGDKPPLECAVRVDIMAYLKRPKSHYGTGRNAEKLKASAPKYPEVKPDEDNITKFVYDALTGLCWDDDKRVIGGEKWKVYADHGQPRVEIWIEEMQ